MTEWTIRSARADDAGALAACIEAAYDIYDGRGLALPAVTEGVAGDIAAHLVWVAESGGTIVGGLILTVHDGYAHLANVAVDPKSAGQGLGRALIARAEAEARARGLSEIRLATHAGLTENVGLYAHLGYAETGRLGNRVFMAKRL